MTITGRLRRIHPRLTSLKSILGIIRHLNAGIHATEQGYCRAHVVEVRMIHLYVGQNLPASNPGLTPEIQHINQTGALVSLRLVTIKPGHGRIRVQDIIHGWYNQG